MEILKIKKDDLIKELTAGLKRAGSTEWKIYVNLNGDVDLRHNTYNNNEWHELMDMYCFSDYENDGKYPGDDDYDYEESAIWIVDNLDPIIIEVNDEEQKEYMIEVV